MRGRGKCCCMTTIGKVMIDASFSAGAGNVIGFQGQKRKVGSDVRDREGGFVGWWEVLMVGGVVN
eukprot:12781561-Ditylum_brightwellii.AAC.1